MGQKTKVINIKRQHTYNYICFKVNKKDMFALTTKNYELLPEIVKKKENNQKAEDFKQRMEKVKSMEKV